MAKWFAYSDRTYYPDAYIVEADTPEGARDEVVRFFGERHPEPIAIFPLDACALFQPWTDDARQTIEETLEALP